MSNFSVDNLSAWLKLKFSKVGLAASKFKSRRIDYYEYIADVITDSGGRKKISDIFRSDAERYASEPRGVLSAYWLDQYSENGANLAATWANTLPDEDLMIIRVAQLSGGSGIEQSLRDVARVSKAIDGAKAEFISTIAVGFVGMAIGFSMLLCVPFVIVPALSDAFAMVPPEMWGSLSKKLLALGEVIKSTWHLLLLGIVGAVGWVSWALPNLVGNFRQWLDKNIILFKLYRDFRGALFLATLASMVKRRSGKPGLKLRESLVDLSAEAEPWLRWHAERIIENIDLTGGQSSDSTVNLFDTGVLDRDIMFYLLDMIESKGFDSGLELAGLRTEQTAVKSVGARAKILRWILLGGGVATVVLIAAWTMATVFEMKTAMMSALS